MKEEQEKTQTGYIAPDLTYSKQTTTKSTAPDDKIARTFPDTPMQVLGTTALSKYLAANMMNGAADIDISQFKDDAATITQIQEAFWEAKNQNGLVP